MCVFICVCIYVCVCVCVCVCVGRRAYVCVAPIHLNVDYSNRNFTHFFQDGEGSRKVIRNMASFFQDGGHYVKSLGTWRHFSYLSHGVYL